jgi:RHS repeat-associated protein
VFTHDLDGNLTSDGRWTYTWDAENRLLRVQSRSDTPQTSWRRVEWQYDALGRRIRQTTWSWLAQSNLWVVTEELKFVSDPLLFGRHVVDLNASNNVAVRTYVWGLDLSETLEGAGGVSGLLCMTLHTGSGPTAGTHFCAYDGNGEIVALAAASDGLESARYEYGPFAEPIRLTGPAAALNPFRFSTKRTDPTTDLVLYEYRAYSPVLGQWLSRDPIGEQGREALYGFAGNDCQNRFDVDGRFFPGSGSNRCPKCGAWIAPWGPPTRVPAEFAQAAKISQRVRDLSKRHKPH